MTDSATSPRINDITKHSFLDTLAEIACRTGPLLPTNSENGTESLIKPHEFQTRRPRANSEPWIRNSLSGINALTVGSLPLVKKESPTSITLPQMLEKYASIYNKNGRIGIYTREERNTIISRFHQKRKRRVWKKKIRYHCRKNLADSRVRVKGRFVKSTKPEEKETQEAAARHNMNVLLMATLKSEDLGSGENGDQDATEETTSGGTADGDADADVSTDQTKHTEDEDGDGEDGEEDADEYDESVMFSFQAQSRKRMRRHSIAY
mmetsp:Transcript_5191/g.7970  ORF Transcript_5191/g.7970 Transcript_5191/m.7970 type:complete len:265 (+) Transcript_5191:178-972(+)